MSIVLKVMAAIIGLLMFVGGVWWMFAPETAAGGLGIVLSNTAALNTARGDLGGMFVAVGVLVALGLRTSDGRWLQAVAAIVGCIAAGRAIGIVFDGFEMSSLVSVSIEVLIVVVMLATAYKLDGELRVGPQ